MERRWVHTPIGNKKTIDLLTNELSIHPVLASLLVQRGVNTFEEARSFFRPQLSDLHDPFLMKDMGKAVLRICQAIDRNEKILVYGDYDVDGTTAIALMYSFLKKFTSNIEFYVPDRYDEGYGISIKGIDFAHDNGFNLIIALDCGIKAIEQADYANTFHIDLIICDHHRPDNEIPKAFAILNPKRLDCDYPYDELSGCGVGFKLVQAIAIRKEVPFDELLPYLDLVAVSIASDIVFITGENRILAYYGLKLINTQARPGIIAILMLGNLIKVADKNNLNSNYVNTKEFSISDLVFYVGPRINAAGRMDTARSSVNILLSETIEEAIEIGKTIDDCNTERKFLDTSSTTEAVQMIQSDPAHVNARTTVIFQPNWHKGVIGIVASRLTETYYRPTIVFTLSNGLISGSARSVKDFDIYNAIEACSDLLEHFGGHKFAAGLSLKPENLEVFRKRFEDEVSSRIEEYQLTPEIEIDHIIKISDIDAKFFRVLKQFAPFGPGNMSPLFETRGVIDAGYSRIVGLNHLKLSIYHPAIASSPISCIAFQQGKHFKEIELGTPFDICFHIEENEWNGKVSLQLNIRDIRIPSIDCNDNY
ncbi:MAG: single-stranded-DNA-specific exonuclease RecJ [Bacteroidota bacterium]